MYESPIELIVKDTYQKILKQREENIFKAILETGVKVDKEELLKALKYDREQYKKGYIDGAKELAKMLTESFPSDNEPYQYWEIHSGVDNLIFLHFK